MLLELKKNFNSFIAHPKTKKNFLIDCAISSRITVDYTEIALVSHYKISCESF